MDKWHQWSRVQLESYNPNLRLLVLSLDRHLVMAQQRLALWNAEGDLEEEVDLLTIGNYGQNVQYEDGKFSFFIFFFIFFFQYEDFHSQHICINLRSTNRLSWQCSII